MMTGADLAVRREHTRYTLHWVGLGGGGASLQGQHRQVGTGCSSAAAPPPGSVWAARARPRPPVWRLGTLGAATGAGAEPHGPARPGPPATTNQHTAPVPQMSRSLSGHKADSPGWPLTDDRSLSLHQLTMDRSPEPAQEAGLHLPSAPALKRLSEARAQIAGPQPPVSPGAPPAPASFPRELGHRGGTSPWPAQQAEGHGQAGCSRPQAALRPLWGGPPPTQAKKSPPRGEGYRMGKTTPNPHRTLGGLTEEPQHGLQGLPRGLLQPAGSGRLPGSRAVPAGALECAPPAAPPPARAHSRP